MSDDKYEWYKCDKDGKNKKVCIGPFVTSMEAVIGGKGYFYTCNAPRDVSIEDKKKYISADCFDSISQIRFITPDKR